jgi:hypothetical protein
LLDRGWQISDFKPLLQPGRINAYAQAVIRTLQADEHQRGCLIQ